MTIKATVNRKIDRVVNLAPKVISIAGSGVGFDTIVANGTTIVTTISGTTLTITPNNSITISGVSATGRIFIGVANASITTPGQVQLNDTINSTSILLAATANSVNTAYNKALVADTDAVAAFGQANTAGLQGLGAFVLANAHTINITAAFAKANTADTDAIAAFGKANTADLDAIAAFTKANTADLDAIAAFAAGNVNAVNITSAFTKANTADTDAIAAFGKANTADLDAIAAFAKANTADLDAAAAFGKANTADLDAVASFATANAALPKAGGTMSGAGANIIFDTKNTGIYWTSAGAGGSQNFIYAPISNTISFGTSNVEQMRLESTGILNVINAVWVSNMNVYPTVVAAFAAANAGGGSGTTAAFSRANNSWGNIFVTGTDSTYNWTASGNNGITANNSANTVKFVVGSGMEIDVDAGNNAVRFVTGAFGAANTALNVAQSAFATANAGGAGAVIAVFQRANNSWGNLFFTAIDSTYNWVAPGNIGLTATNSANTVKIITGVGMEIDIDTGNNAVRFLTGAFGAANTALNVAQSAFATANAGGAGAVVAVFQRANNSWGNIFVTGTDSTYNWSNVAPGNIGLLATNSANTIKIINGSGLEIDVDAGNNALRFSTGAFDKANTADTDAIAAFTKANTADLDAIAAFGTANLALPKAGGSVTGSISTTSNIIFTTKNTGVYWTTAAGDQRDFVLGGSDGGNTISFGTANTEKMRLDTGNLIMTAANVVFLGGPTLLPAILWISNPVLGGVTIGSPKANTLYINTGPIGAATSSAAILIDGVAGTTIVGNLVMDIGSNIILSGGGTGIYFGPGGTISGLVNANAVIRSTVANTLNVYIGASPNLAAIRIDYSPSASGQGFRVGTPNVVIPFITTQALNFADVNTATGGTTVGSDWGIFWSNGRSLRVDSFSGASANDISIYSGPSASKIVTFTMGGNGWPAIDCQANIGLLAANSGLYFEPLQTYIYKPQAGHVSFVISGNEAMRIVKTSSSGIVNVISSLLISDMNVYPTVVAAFGTANAAGGSGIAAAFGRANNSWGNIFVTGTDSTYNWVAPGNIGITATNSANTVKIIAGVGMEIDVDTGNNAVRFVTGAFAKANTADTDAIAAFGKANNSAVTGLWFHIDGGGQAITTGKKMWLPAIPFAGTIISWTVMSDASCNANIELWKSPYASFPVPTVANTVHGAGTCYITLSNQQNRQNTTLDNWTTSISANDTIAVNVNSVDTATFIDILLKVAKT